MKQTKERNQKRYMQVQNDRPYQLALKKLAADEGLTTTEWLARRVKEAHPEIDELVRKFERA